MDLNRCHWLHNPHGMSWNESFVALFRQCEKDNQFCFFIVGFREFCLFWCAWSESLLLLLLLLSQSCASAEATSLFSLLRCNSNFRFIDTNKFTLINITRRWTLRTQLISTMKDVVNHTARTDPLTWNVKKRITIYYTDLVSLSTRSIREYLPTPKHV